MDSAKYKVDASMYAIAVGAVREPPSGLLVLPVAVLICLLCGCAQTRVHVVPEDAGGGQEAGDCCAEDTGGGAGGLDGAPGAGGAGGSGGSEAGVDSGTDATVDAGPECAKHIERVLAVL
jgi:hypothetical protein